MWMHETGTFSPTPIPTSLVRTVAPVSQTGSPVSQGSIPPVSSATSMPFSEGTKTPSMIG